MMADILRRTSKKVLLVCNKVDNYDLIYSSHEFYSLGLGEPYCISSMSGSGTGRPDGRNRARPAPGNQERGGKSCPASPS